ncbi:MAG TPA: type VI secretion system protein TssA [Pyrinomonadaceae bacterium]|jgi:type VI secretion system ImpA family protein|nr:type VI secretion system protein TssA [Pyrinomonadaceae bacterium]
MSAYMPHTLDLETLLAPVPGGRPSGESLREEDIYDRIRKARREDDPRLSQGIYQSEPKRADWPAVESLASEALSTRTKDLQLAAWLTEAWTHLYGLAGAREGLRLMAELCERFWDGLHPELEGEDCEARVSPVVWVNEKLSVKIKLLGVSAPQAGEVPPYSYADCESAAHLEHLSKKDPKALQTAEARGQVTPSKFHTSVMLTERNFYAELHDDATSALDACGALEAVLTKLCGPAAAPSLGRFREAVEGVRRLAEDVLGSRPAAEYELEAGESSYVYGEDDGEDDGRAAWSSGAPIRSRAEAYQRLAEAADYLLRTEPHSPTPYLVRRAVEWGSMSLQEVLQQLVRNDAEMQELTRLLRLTPEGVRK